MAAVPEFDARLPAALRHRLLHDPKLVAHMEKIGEKGADMANDIAGIDGAEYGTMTQNDANTERARVYIRPENAEATLDDAYHNTMLKVWSGMKGM